MKSLKWLKLWWATRNFAFLWQGLPALLMLFALLVGGLYYTAWNSTKVHDLYAGARLNALAAGDLQTARIASERLVRVATSDLTLASRLPEHVFYLALCLKGLGSVRDAEQLFAKVAPMTGDSALAYPQAHLYMAKMMWSEATEKNELLLVKVQRHLLRAAVDEPGLEEAHQLLGELYLHKGEWEPARRHLLKAVDKRGECLLLLAILSQNIQDRESTRQWSTKANSYFQQRLDASSVEDPVARVGLAKSDLLLGEYAKAILVYQTGLHRTGEPGYKLAIAAIYAQWIDAETREPSKSLKDLLEKVQKGLLYDPTNEALIRRLIDLSQQGGAAAAAAAVSIRELLAEGGDTTILHFCLGVEALGRLDSVTARNHFDLAFVKSPNLPQIANNMAMMLSTGKDADLERAFAIIDPVAQRFPGWAPVLDTRGQILTKMKRWKEAVSDLETALKGMPDSVETHAALALCYENLGLLDLAAEHGKRAKRLPAVIGPVAPPAATPAAPAAAVPAAGP